MPYALNMTTSAQAETMQVYRNKVLVGDVTTVGGVEQVIAGQYVGDSGLVTVYNDVAYFEPILASGVKILPDVQIGDVLVTGTRSWKVKAVNDQGGFSDSLLVTMVSLKG